MKTNPFKEKVLAIIQANPGITSFDIRVKTGEKLDDKLLNRTTAMLAKLVEDGFITRTYVDPSSPVRGYNYWYNSDRIEIPPVVPERSIKAQEKVDFVLNLVETKPGITSSRIRQAFAVNGFGAKETATNILEKLLTDKLVQRRQIQAGNPGAGYCYWAADATPTFLAAAEAARKAAPVPQRKSIVLPSYPSANEPVANFPAPPANPTQAVNTANANIEIAIRLCEIEAFRNPEQYAEYMACAENIRKVVAKTQ